MRARMTKLTRRNLLFSMTAAAMAPAAARADHKLAENEYFEVTRTELTVAGLDSAHDGLVVAHLTDLHIGRDVPDGRVIAAVRAVNELAPDAIALTGDFVTSKRDDYDRVPQLLSSLVAPKFAVLGNHDHWSEAPAIRQRLEGVNVTVLQNAHTVTSLRGKEFAFIGVDDATSGHADADEAFKGTEAGSRLVLTHTPSEAARLPAWAGDVVLAGHTHGGQWNIPGLTPGLFARTGQKWFRGEYQVRGNTLYVNRGLGFGRGTRLPRLNSDPEVAVITLRAAKKS